jgi:large subunit ribosomal protein L32
MPVPKRKKSRARSRTRRSHDALTAPNTIECSNCGEPALPHRVCDHCGYYKGRPVKEVKEV